MATTFDLIRILGRQELIKLQQAVGPAHVYIPNVAREDHPVAAAVGVELLGLICQEHGGTTIWIGNGYANMERNGEILQLVRSGLPKENIARRFGISIRYVRFLTRHDEVMVYSKEARAKCRQLAAARTRYASLRGEVRELER